MKYLINIPKPKSSRMLGQDKILLVEYKGGWEPPYISRYIIPHNEFSCIIDINGALPQQIGVCDKQFFEIFIEYTNKNGSRTERYKLPILPLEK